MDQMDRPDLRATDASENHDHLSPYCAHLRSKKILMRTGLPRTDQDVLDGSNWVWCGETELAIGPDGCSAGPEDCRSGRECFRSPFENLT